MTSFHRRAILQQYWGPVQRCEKTKNKKQKTNKQTNKTPSDIEPNEAFTNHIGDGHHDGNRSDDSRINCRDCPSGPTTLRCASYHKSSDGWHVGVVLGHVVLHSSHCIDTRASHGQARQPSRIRPEEGSSQQTGKAKLTSGLPPKKTKGTLTRSH